MLETFTKCCNPQRIYNKYIHDYVLVPCGKCDYCKDELTKRWVARMFQERQCWQFCYSLYLDYNDDHLPMFHLCGEYLTESQQRFWKGRHEFSELNIPLSDFDSLLIEDVDKEYFYTRLYEHYTCIPHASVRDIQNFKKRLNRYLQREVTGKYVNFRSCIAAEYGPTTFRPHYHGILYFNDPRIAENLERLVAKAWSSKDTGVFGHTEVEADRGNTAGYVAKYIKKPSHLPSCYAHPMLRPFFLTSRHPPIGSLLESRTEILELFHSGSCNRVAFSSGENGWQVESFPLDRRTENKLFPKCPLYGEVPASFRSELYKSVVNWRGLIPTFEEYVYNIVCRCSDQPFIGSENEDVLFLKFLRDIGYNSDWIEFPIYANEFRSRMLGSSIRTQFSLYMKSITDNWTNCGRLRSLYAAGCRVWYQSQVFGVSFDYYLSRIFLHYEKKELILLKCFYQSQEDYFSSSDADLNVDLKFFYPLTYEVSLQDHPLSKKYFAEKDLQRKLSDRTKFKNDYFESLKDKVQDRPLYDLILNYYYGKECNEIIEAIT